MSRKERRREDIEVEYFAFDGAYIYAPQAILMSIDESPYVDHAAVRQILMKVFCRRITNECAYHQMTQALSQDNVVLNSFKEYMKQSEKEGLE